MTDDTNFLEWAFKGIVGGAFVVGAYLWSDLVKDVKGLSKAQTDFQLDAEKRFAKDDHVNENLNRINTTMNILQGSVNTNTTMTSVIMEKVTSMSERMKTQ